MSESALSNVSLPDPTEVARSINTINDQSRRLISDYLQRQVNGELNPPPDMSSIGSAFMDMTTNLMSQPERLVEAQLGLWTDFLELWQRGLCSMYTGQLDAAIGSQESDRRFRHDDWNDYPIFSFIKEAYLLNARWVLSTVRKVKGLDENVARKVDFYTRQFVDALSPSNFVFTNPEVLRRVSDTGGQSLLDGLANLMSDLERGKGKLAIRMTDLDAFELGKNVATTAGKVVFQNELMQLIQYQPSTDQVHKRPMLIVPPWINKYYILDLQPKNSLIKWAVDQGHTVFVISWVNPDEELADKRFDDYLTTGAFAALDAIEKETGEHQVNAVGYCLGGTLLASALAWLAAEGDERISSATFLTTLIDFSKPGELEVFLDDEQVTALERDMARRGYLDGSDMATTFNMLRANDLIWSFFINNYLLGKEPFPFDLLYWNSDSTRMPATMHSFYLRNMYLENRLSQPGGITLAGHPIDLGKIKTPMYFLSTIEDHIAPWRSTYAGTQLSSGPVKFVLGGSGHIAGVVNPPSKDKYGYWTNEALPADPNEWFSSANKNEGSWWHDWDQWLEAYKDEWTAPRQPGSGALGTIEEAPGSYVKLRLVN